MRHQSTNLYRKFDDISRISDFEDWQLRGNQTLVVLSEEVLLDRDLSFVHLNVAFLCSPSKLTFGGISEMQN